MVGAKRYFICEHPLQFFFKLNFCQTKTDKRLQIKSDSTPDSLNQPKLVGQGQTVGKSQQHHDDLCLVIEVV